MQSEIIRILKDKYLDMGWYSNNQIRKMCLEQGFDINASNVSKNTASAYRFGFLDRISNKRGFLYRYRSPSKNNKINFLR